MKRIKIIMTEKQAVFWFLIAQNHLDVSDDKDTRRDSLALRNQIVKKLNKECYGWAEKQRKRS